MTHKAAPERQQQLSCCFLRFGLVVVVMLVSLQPIRAQDPLPSWNDTAPKKAILAFVKRVTKNGSPDFVPVPERIATFDKTERSGQKSRCRSCCCSQSIG
jgi:hypothetical protein